MKRMLSICYWIAAIVIVAAVMLSFHYRLSEALFIGTAFLPGALAAKFAYSKIAPLDKAEKIRNGIFAAAGILVGEYLLLFLAHYAISILRAGLNAYYNWPDLPDALENPVFITILVLVLAVGSVYMDSLLNRKYPSVSKTIKFLSDRRPVTVDINDILYVESNDTVTVVHMKDGAEYRNKTPISQWESILEGGFIRIHRSFIVNRGSITSIDKDFLYLGDLELPVSRKYKTRLNSLK